MVFIYVFRYMFRHFNNIFILVAFIPTPSSNSSLHILDHGSPLPLVLFALFSPCVFGDNKQKQTTFDLMKLN